MKSSSSKRLSLRRTNPATHPPITCVTYAVSTLANGINKCAPLPSTVTPTRRAFNTWHALSSHNPLFNAVTTSLFDVQHKCISYDGPHFPRISRGSPASHAATYLLTLAESSEHVLICAFSDFVISENRRLASHPNYPSDNVLHSDVASAISLTPTQLTRSP